MKPGRNEPCPCGSGEKYKNCCLAAERQRGESAEQLAWTRVRRAIGDTPTLLGRFVAEVYGPDAIEEAWDAFTVWEGYGFDPESPLMAIFMPWLYHCWEPEPWEDTSVVDEPLRGRTPTSVLLERQAGRLDPLLERYLEVCVATPFSFHEILRCDVGRGFLTRDVLTGEEHEVLERSASESMSVGDVLFCQLVAIEGIVLLEACSPYALSPMDKIAIIELRERIEAAPATAPDFGGPLRNWDIEIRELYVELICDLLDPQPPVLHNTDADLEGVDSEGAGADEDLAALPEVREHLERMFERHYDDWVEQELPVLGGRRPIDVVREPNGREKVEALVADMERRAARMNPGIGDAAFARLRERLGLTRG